MKSKMIPILCVVFLYIISLHSSEASSHHPDEYTFLVTASRVSTEEIVSHGDEDEFFLTEIVSPSSEDFGEPITVTNNRLIESYIDAFQQGSYKISKYEAFKYLISFLGAIGPIIPQIAVPMHIGEEYNSKFIGYLLAVTTGLYVEGVGSWLIWELISDGEKLFSAAKEQKARDGLCSWGVVKEVGIGVLALGLGAISSVPDVYKAYKYNTIKELAIISFIYDTIPHTIGFYKFFSAIKSRNIGSPCVGEVENEITRAIRAIDISAIGYIEKCKDAGTEDFNVPLTELTAAGEIYAYLTQDLPESLFTMTDPNIFAKGIPRKISGCLAILPPLATAVGLSMVFSYNGWGLITTNQIARIPLSLLSVFPAFALNVFVIKKVGETIFDKIYYWKHNFPSTEYLSNFYPKLNIFFLCSSFSLAAVLSLSSFTLISENLAGTFLEDGKYFFTTLAVGTDLIFGTYTIYYSMVRYGQAIISRVQGGSHHVIGCLNKLNDTRKSIFKSSCKMVNNFWQSFANTPEVNSNSSV